MSTLLHEIVADAPKLDGALCTGRAPDWDAEDPDTVADAIELCQRCPALRRCGDWLDSLPPHKRPAGVTAGQVIMSSGTIRKAS